jgi:O-antigen/teichoic acid export membrane protein
MEKRTIIGNSLAILINRLSQSITTFILIAFIARTLGPYSLGQYSLAFNYYYLFMTCTSQGLKTLFTRELSRHPEQTSSYLVSGSLLQLFLSLIGYLGLFLLISILPYSSDTSAVCYILGLMIIPFSLSNITEAVFQAQEKMYLITLSTTPIYILRVISIIWIITLKYNLNFVCGFMVISETLIFLVQLLLIIPSVKPQWQIQWNFIWTSLKYARTFIVIEGMAVLKGRMLTIILSLLSTEVVIGLYSSVGQLMQPFEIIAHSLIVAVFPAMSKSVLLGKEKQHDLAEMIIQILLCVGLPLMIGLFFIGEGILVLFYGDPRFAEGSLALKIMALGLFVDAFTRPLGYLLVANGFERVNLIEVFTGNLLTIVVGVPLIYHYQLTGIAITGLILSISSSSQYTYGVYTRLFPLNIIKILIRPLLIGTFILLVFLGLQMVTNNLIITMISVTIAYCLFAVFLVANAMGGINVLMSKILVNRK